MRRSRKNRDEQLRNATDHWNQRWQEHYAAYLKFIRPQREHATVIMNGDVVVFEQLDGLWRKSQWFTISEDGDSH